MRKLDAASSGEDIGDTRGSRFVPKFSNGIKTPEFLSLHVTIICTTSHTLFISRSMGRLMCCPASQSEARVHSTAKRNCRLLAQRESLKSCLDALSKEAGSASQLGGNLLTSHSFAEETRKRGAVCWPASIRLTRTLRLQEDAVGVNALLESRLVLCEKPGGKRRSGKPAPVDEGVMAVNF